MELEEHGSTDPPGGAATSHLRWNAKAKNATLLTLNNEYFFFAGTLFMFLFNSIQYYKNAFKLFCYVISYFGIFFHALDFSVPIFYKQFYQLN